MMELRERQGRALVAGDLNSSAVAYSMFCIEHARDKRYYVEHPNSA
jgi:hypothetical protein